MSAEDRAELMQLVEDQRRELFNASAVISACAYACINESMDRDQLSDVMLVACRMVDGVAAKLEALTKV